MPSFHTRSSSRKTTLTVVFTFIPMFLLAFLGLKIAVVTWLFFEGILLLAFAFCVFLTSRTHWELDFQRNTLTLFDTGNRQTYYFDRLTQFDLVITQTQKQKAKNSCNLKIVGSPFGIYDVAQCEELSSYIQMHFSRKKN